MVFRVSQNPGDWRHWGKTFWMMCVITTAIGVVLGILLHPRTWCAFCPMGTLQGALGKLGWAVFLPAALGWGGAILLVVVVMVAWAALVTWNEDSGAFSAG
jgi:hypothetical protein